MNRILELRQLDNRGYVCDDGLVRCGACAREYKRERPAVREVERYVAPPGDDWCSICNRDTI